MLIAFWSNARGRNGVTSNLACVSAIWSLKNPKKRSVLFENHSNINNLGNLMSNYSREDLLAEDSPYLLPGGMEQAVRMIHRANNYEENATWESLSYLGEQIYYLPRGTCANEEILEYELNQYYPQIMRIMSHFGHRVYADLGGCQYESSKKIVKNADIVVVNLSQNPYVLSHFFRNYSSIRDKAFYLISNYNSKSKYSIQFISKTYGIPLEQLGVIPYHIPFADAMLEGNLLPFLHDNMEHAASENQGFIQIIKETVDKLEQRIHDIYGEREDEVDAKRKETMVI